MLATEREGVNERRDRSVPRGTLLHGENQERALSSSHRGTRCSLCGSCPRIAQRSLAFRRRSPADSPVGALARRGAQLGTPHSKLQRVETPSRHRRPGCTRQDHLSFNQLCGEGARRVRVRGSFVKGSVKDACRTSRYPGGTASRGLARNSSTVPWGASNRGASAKTRSGFKARVVTRSNGPA